MKGRIRMKILIFGRGAIGTQYAWAFEKAGHDVEFYVRKGRRDQYGPYVDLKISDARQKKIVEEKWPVRLTEEISSSKKYDLIFLSINPDQVKEAAKVISPVIGDATLLFFNNFGKDPFKATSPVPEDQIVVGFPGAGGGFEGSKLYGNMFKQVQIGIRDNAPKAREKAVIELFKSAGFKPALKKDIRSFLINHYAANAAMEAEVLKHGSFENVAKNSDALADMIRNIREMVPYLKALNVHLDMMTRILSVLPPTAVGKLLRKTLYAPGTMAYEALAHNHYKAGYSVKEIVKEATSSGMRLQRMESTLRASGTEII